MPAFDWADYLALARELLHAMGEASMPEARQRAAISRAYYAAFNLARAYVRDADQKAFDGESVHRPLAVYLENDLGDARRNDVGKLLNQLRTQRNRADYDVEIVDVARLAQSAAYRAGVIVEKLAALRAAVT